MTDSTHDADCWCCGANPKRPEGARRVRLTRAAQEASRSPIESAAAAYVNVIARQLHTLAEIQDGMCTLACAAATTRYGECECPCGGANHAALWGTAVVPAGDWGEDPEIVRDRTRMHLGRINAALWPAPGDAPMTPASRPHSVT